MRVGAAMIAAKRTRFLRGFKSVSETTKRPGLIQLRARGARKQQNGGVGIKRFLGAPKGVATRVYQLLQNVLGTFLGCKTV